MKKTMSLVLAGAALAFAFMGCNEKTTSQTSSAAAEVQEEDEGGFVEHDIGDEQQAGFLAVNGVYFQAVDMKSGEGNTQKGADFTMHIEADIAAMENDLGFVVDQFVPGLTVDYEVVDQSSGNVAAKGTFMQMNASDGPHYGANINLNQAGTYTARFIIHSPAENTSSTPTKTQSRAQTSKNTGRTTNHSRLSSKTGYLTERKSSRNITNFC